MEDNEVIKELNNNGYDGDKILKQVILRSEKIHELGNYTILSGKLNNLLKNYEWDRKLNGEGGKRGIKYYSSLTLNRELCEYQEWTEDKISERTLDLKKRILKIW